MDNLKNFLGTAWLVDDKPNKLEMDLRALFARPDMPKAVKELQEKELEKEDE